MSMLSVTHAPPTQTSLLAPPVFNLRNNGPDASKVQELFTQFVGETFYGQMIKAMRSTVSKPAYFHGGRAEEVFQGQLDQAMAERLTEASADKFAEPLFRHQFANLADEVTATAAPANGLFGLNSLSPR